VESQSASKDAAGVNTTPGWKLPAAVRRVLFSCFSRIFLQAFTMTFMAEWGDRSQIATVILAAREV
jgi:putative Ca2+/H+ antiporter (TMEM165/GDT1 family)